MSTALEQKQAQQIAAKDKKIAQLEKHNHYLQQRDHFHCNENKWLAELNANKELSPAAKLTQWALRQHEHKNGHLAGEDGLIPVFMFILAAMIGLSAKQVGQYVKKFDEAKLLTRKMAGAKSGNDYKKQVFVRVGDTIRIRPGEARMSTPRNQGGDPVKRRKCSHCGDPNGVEERRFICEGCGTVDVLSTKHHHGVSDLPAPHPIFEELPVAVTRPALTLVPTCKAEPVEEEPYVDPYDEPDVKPVEMQKKGASCETSLIVHPVETSQVATPTVKSRLNTRVCQHCGQANRLLWKYNTSRAKWECLICYHYEQ